MTENLQPTLRPRPEFAIPLAILMNGVQETERKLIKAMSIKERKIAPRTINLNHLIKLNVKINHLDNTREALLFKAALLLIDTEDINLESQDNVRADF